MRCRETPKLIGEDVAGLEEEILMRAKTSARDRKAVEDQAEMYVESLGEHGELEGFVSFNNFLHLWPPILTCLKRTLCLCYYDTLNHLPQAQVMPL